jgi:hypothetical protein
MAFAMADVSGSKIMTSPPKSSLKEAVLHLGQTLSLVIKRQFGHAFSLI